MKKFKTVATSVVAMAVLASSFAGCSLVKKLDTDAVIDATEDLCGYITSANYKKLSGMVSDDVDEEGLELNADVKPASQYTAEANKQVYALLDFDDKQEFVGESQREAERKVSPAFSKAAVSKGRAFWQGFGAARPDIPSSDRGTGRRPVKAYVPHNLSCERENHPTPRRGLTLLSASLTFPLTGESLRVPAWERPEGIVS